MVSSPHCLQPMEMRQTYCQDLPGVAHRGLCGVTEPFSTSTWKNPTPGTQSEFLCEHVSVTAEARPSSGQGEGEDYQEKCWFCICFYFACFFFFWQHVPQSTLQEYEIKGSHVYKCIELSSVGCKTTYNPYHCLGNKMP